MKRKELISEIIETINTEGIDESYLKEVLKLATKAVNQIPIQNEKDEKGNLIWKVCISDGSKCATWYYTLKAKSRKDAIKKAKKEILALEVPKNDWNKNISGLKRLVRSLEAEKKKKEKENPDDRYPNGELIDYERLEAFAPNYFRKDEEDRNPGYIRYFEADDR